MRTQSILSRILNLSYRTSDCSSSHPSMHQTIFLTFALLLTSAFVCATIVSRLYRHVTPHSPHHTIQVESSPDFIGLTFNINSNNNTVVIADVATTKIVRKLHFPDALSAQRYQTSTYVSTQTHSHSLSLTYTLSLTRSASYDPLDYTYYVQLFNTIHALNVSSDTLLHTIKLETVPTITFYDTKLKKVRMAERKQRGEG